MKRIKSYSFVILGSILSASCFGLVVLPQKFAAGGVTGFAVLLQDILPIPLSSLVLIINMILLLIGWIFVGPDFMAKTVISSIVYPIALAITQKITLFHELSHDPFVSSIFAGCLLGLGAGLILIGNGSSGGFDVLGVILNKKFGISISTVMYAIDFFIILTQTIENGLMKTVYGVITIIVSFTITNKVLTRGKSASRIFVMSDQCERIRDELLQHQDVGMTYLYGESGYLSEPVKVIMTVVHIEKVERVKKCIYTIDPAAFLFVDMVHYVSGRGYTIER